MADVFISYSRQDNQTGFIDRLVDGLHGQGIDVWIDREDIPLSADWWQEICKGIDGANNFSAIISPAFVQSEVCSREVEYALSKNKRFVPIIYEELHTAEAKKALHPNLGNLNWVKMSQIDNFQSALNEYIQTLRTDLNYVSKHTRLLVRATEWDAAKRNVSLTLRGSELEEAEQWLLNSRGKPPRPTSLQKQFIDASRKSSVTRQRVTCAATTIALLVTSLLGVGVYIETQNRSYAQATAQFEATQRAFAQATTIAEANSRATQQAIAEDSMARSESQRLAALAVDELAAVPPNPYTATLLAIRALNTAYSAQADATLVRAVRENAALDAKTLNFADDVRSISYSPQGYFMVTNDAIIRDVWTGEALLSLEGHETRLNSVAYSFYGTYIVAASVDGTAIIWDAATGELLRKLTGHTDSVNTAAFSPDMRYIVTASDDGTAMIWDAETGNQRRTLSGHKGKVTSAAFSSDGNLIVTTSGGNTYSPDNVAIIWNARTGNQLTTLTGHLGDVYSADFNYNNHFLVTASEDGTAIVWDVRTGERIWTLDGHNDRVTSASFSPYDPLGPFDPLIVTTSADTTAMIWDATTGERLRTLAGHTFWVNNATFNPYAQTIMTGSFEAIIWNLNMNNEKVIKHDDRITSAAYSPDGRFIITTSWDNITIIWDASTGEQMQTLNGGGSSFNIAAFSPDGQFIATDSENNTVTIWDAMTGQSLQTLSGHTGIVRNLMFHPDGKAIVTASDDKTAIVWDTVTGLPLRTLAGHTEWVQSAAYSPDGHFIITASLDGTAIVWDADTGEQMRILTGHTDSVYSAAYSPDGLFIVTAGFDGVIIWNANTGEQISTLTGHPSEGGATYSHDGHFIVASGGNLATLWDAATGKYVRTLNGHSDRLSSAVFSPDGRSILTASEDGTAIIWDTDYHTFTNKVCERLRFMRDFTLGERQRFGISDNESTCPQFAS